MKSIITEKIQSKNDNYEIPIQIFIPLNHSLNSPIIIYYHGGLKRDSQSFSLYFHLFLRNKSKIISIKFKSDNLTEFKIFKLSN